MTNFLKKFFLFRFLNLVFKSKRHVFKSAQELKFCQGLVKNRNLGCLEGDALIPALRQKIDERRLNRKTKRKGELNIFLAYCGDRWEKALPLSLAPFGKVTVFDWRAHGFDDRRRDWMDHGRRAMNAAMLDMFLQAHGKKPFDIFIGYLSGYYVDPAILKKISDAGPVIFNFCWDDKLLFFGKKVRRCWMGPSALASIVDLNLTNAPQSIVKYSALGGLALFWPEAAHPDIHRPYQVQFDYDVSFVGGCYGWRPMFIEKLARQGIKVECFGQGWPNGPVSNEDMVKLYSRSRINLGFSGVGQSWDLTCLKGRDFEIPMSGGLYLSQDHPELSLVYDVGKEILTYRNAEDCAQTIRGILADPVWAQDIRQAGRTRCLRDHTYATRWSQIFQMSGLLESSQELEGVLCRP